MTSSSSPGMDPGVKSHGMKADPPGYLWSKYEYFLMSRWWDILHSSCLNVKLWSNSTNRTEVRPNEQTNNQTYERKDENYIPLYINAGGIKMSQLVSIFFIYFQLKCTFLLLQHRFCIHNGKRKLKLATCTFRIVYIRSPVFVLCCEYILENVEKKFTAWFFF